jgi:hypothetical protein
MNIAAPSTRDPMARIYDDFTDYALSSIFRNQPRERRAMAASRKALRLAEYAADQAGDVTLAQLLRAIIAAQDAAIEVSHYGDKQAEVLAQQAAKGLFDAAQVAVDDWGLE